MSRRNTTGRTPPLQRTPASQQITRTPQETTTRQQITRTPQETTTRQLTIRTPPPPQRKPTTRTPPQPTTQTSQRLHKRSHNKLQVVEGVIRPPNPTE